CSNSSDKA
ncbi:hypothetical protein D018_3588B, partial [Vibrio parahaemolyticus VP2007-007]